MGDDSGLTTEMTAKEFLEQAVASMAKKGDPVVHFSVNTSEGPMYFSLALIGSEEDFKTYGAIYGLLMSGVDEVPERLN